MNLTLNHDVFCYFADEHLHENVMKVFVNLILFAIFIQIKDKRS